MRYPENLGIASRFQELAALFEQQGADPFRTRACRQAAERIAAEWGALRGRRIVRGREGECAEHDSRSASARAVGTR